MRRSQFLLDEFKLNAVFFLVSTRAVNSNDVDDYVRNSLPFTPSRCFDIPLNR